MQIKKFEAPTMQEVLETIKRELGPEAVILQTKQHRKGFGLLSKGSVEVTAAIAEAALKKKTYVESKLPAQDRQKLQKLSAETQRGLYNKYYERSQVDQAAASIKEQVQVTKKNSPSPKKISSVRYADIQEDGTISARPTPVPPVTTAQAESTLIEEVGELRQMIQDLKTQKNDAQTKLENDASLQTIFKESVLQEAFEQLITNGLEKKSALALVRSASQKLGERQIQEPEQVLDHIALEIIERTQVMSLLSGVSKRAGKKSPTIIALVGPTGVGKTTTLAKIASEATLQKGLKTGIINLDTFKVAAKAQLDTYSKILKLPYRSVSSPMDLQNALEDFSFMDLVLIDTSGTSQKDAEAIQRAHELLSTISTLRTCLVLALPTREIELTDMTKRFSLFKPEGLIFSKLDEALVYGAAFNLSQKFRLPLMYFTTGQKVPEDIEEATPERVAALLMDL